MFLVSERPYKHSCWITDVPLVFRVFTINQDLHELLQLNKTILKLQCVGYFS